MPFFYLIHTMNTKEEVINSILEDWTDEFIRDLQASAKDKIKEFTGEGHRSFNISMVKAAAGTAAQITVYFADHLRYFDMRRVQRQKGLPADEIERLKAWVKKKGIQAFMKKHNEPTTYKTKPGNVPETRIINNIVWGISRKKKKLRRRAWYKAVKNEGMRNMYLDLIDALMPFLIEEMKQSLGAK